MRAVVALVLAEVASAYQKEFFTTNAICRRQYCINPIFPGLEDLQTLEKKEGWQCTSAKDVIPALSFCKNVVNYDVGLPQGEAAASVSETAQLQERTAIQSYFFHLSGMGIDAWDHTNPGEADDPCTKAVQRLACYTYFPKCAPHSDPIESPATSYVRPCMSSCVNYIAECNVQCCDESVSCVFSHTKYINGTARHTTAYVDRNGPSMMCTGAAFQTGMLAVFGVLALGLPKRVMMMAAAVMVAMQLQGCDVDVPQHMVGNWRAEPDYLVKYQYVPPGENPRNARLNSCGLDSLALVLQCNSRGTCQPWQADDLTNPVYFCNCGRDWADPECSTPRKKQSVAYVLSLFFGWLGADQFYLGFPIYGSLKLITLGGFGAWWLIDIVRIGSSNVYASDFRTAADLPHWAFVLTVVCFAFVVGFIIVASSTWRTIRNRRKDALLLQAEESNAQTPPYSMSNVPSKGSGGAQPAYSFPGVDSRGGSGFMI